MSDKLPYMEAFLTVTNMAFDPHECTKAFGVQPTSVEVKGLPFPYSRIVNKGQLRPRKQPLCEESCWCLSTDWGQYDTTDSCLKLLIGKIWPSRRAIRKFALGNNLELSIKLNINGAGKRNFLYEISPFVVRAAFYFRAKFGFDVY